MNAIDSTEAMETPRRKRALKTADHLTTIAFRKRKGHGGGPCSYRQMTSLELTALLIAAFEAGAEWESKQ